MDILHRMSPVLALFLFIQLRPSDSRSHSIVATCHHTNKTKPSEWYRLQGRNPSAIHDLTASLSESLTSAIIRWAINIDGSIHSLNGTWISFKNKNYRCQYEPPFTSKKISLTGLQQLWFNFSVSNVCPSDNNDLYAYNLPTPPTGTDSSYIKMAQTDAVQWKPNISAVNYGDKVVVTFSTLALVKKHTIQLKNKTRTLVTVEKGRCKEENCNVELQYMGPCKDLKIKIRPLFENCQQESVAVQHKVDCKKFPAPVYSEFPAANSSVLVAGVGVTLAFLLMLLFCCVTRQVLRRAREPKRSASVRVLMVYPAVDSVFQREVMLLAEFLQSRGGVSVVIDLWEKVSLAGQGPLHWINTQAELADRVLIIPPPQITHTGDLKSTPVPGVADHAVSASASHLFALALNLVSSAAHEPHGLDKFWVVHLKEKSSVQPELRGLRTFILPRDQEKLHQQLLKRNKTSVLSRSFKTSLKNTLDIKHSGAAGHKHCKLSSMA